MIHESFVKWDIMKAIMKWGNITSKEGKAEEAKQCQILYDNILNALKNYF